MLFLEAVEASRRPIRMKILATDVHQRSLDQRRGFVLGHGGDTLRAGPGPDPLNPFRVVVVWADKEQFAAMFAGARVYVFACSTLPSRSIGRLTGSGFLGR